MQNTDKLSTFLTLSEFARETQLSLGGVRKYVREGRISTVHIGRSVRIPRSELDRLLAQSKTANR